MNTSVLAIVNGQYLQLPVESFSENGVVDMVAEEFGNGILIDDLEIVGSGGANSLWAIIHITHLFNDGRKVPKDVLSFDLTIIGVMSDWTGQWRPK